MAKKRISTSELALCGGLIVIGCIIILYAGISSGVSTEIDAICEEACAKYPGTKVEALITYLGKKRT